MGALQPDREDPEAKHRQDTDAQGRPHPTMASEERTITLCVLYRSWLLGICVHGGTWRADGARHHIYGDQKSIALLCHCLDELWILGGITQGIPYLLHRNVNSTFEIHISIGGPHAPA